MLQKRVAFDRATQEDYMNSSHDRYTESIGDSQASKRFADGAVIVRTEQMPWMPWAAPGTYCKVLHMDRSHVKTTLMIKVDANTPLGKHQHMGDAEAYLLEGDFVLRTSTPRSSI